MQFYSGPLMHLLSGVDNWQVVALAKFVSQRVEDPLPLVREAAKDQHHFGGGGVDHIADLRPGRRYLADPR
jgi:hypothetical protein